MPIGLFVGYGSADPNADQSDGVVNLTVGVDMATSLMSAFKIIKNSWKKAF